MMQILPPFAFGLQPQNGYVLSLYLCFLQNKAPLIDGAKENKMIEKMKFFGIIKLNYW